MTAAFPPIHARPDPAAVRALLAAAGLSVADLTAASRADFWGCGAGEELAGVIGLETYGAVALLRSLAVAPDWQGRGLGSALLAHAEQAARQQGGQTLYPLRSGNRPGSGRNGIGQGRCNNFGTLREKPP